VLLAFSSRTRAVLIVVVLSFAAVGAGIMALDRARGSSRTAPPPAPSPMPKSLERPRASARAVPPTAPRLKAKHTPSRKPKPVAPPGAAASPNALPAAIARPLAANRVVVVALYDPAAKLDATALREARAGAGLAGTVFVPIDVTTTDVDALNAHYGVIHDPAVLVLRPPADVVVRIDGFADRDTVAQAAANGVS
jgi:hypothetical protein